MEMPRKRFVSQKINPTRSVKKKDFEEYLRFVQGLMNDDSLKSTIVKYEKELGIDNSLYDKIEFRYDRLDSEPLAKEYLLELMQSSGKSKSDSIERLDRVVSDIMSEEKIDNIFRWLIYYMMSHQKDSNIAKIAELYKREYGFYEIKLPVAEIEEIDSESITIKVDRKVNKKQFVMIWNAIEEYCREYPAERFLRQRLTFLHNEKGYGYGTLAKIYYPEKRKKVNGKRNGIDLVRNLIVRNK